MSPVVKAAVAAQAPNDHASGYGPPARVTLHNMTALTKSATTNARK
jgi:hypothetical protein